MAEQYPIVRIDGQYRQLSDSDRLRLTGSPWFGDGSDGDVTLASDVTLVRDMFYGDLTIPAGFRLNAAGYRVHVRGTLTIEGGAHLSANGNDANGWEPGVEILGSNGFGRVGGPGDPTDMTGGSGGVQGFGHDPGWGGDGGSSGGGVFGANPGGANARSPKYGAPRSALAIAQGYIYPGDSAISIIPGFFGGGAGGGGGNATTDFSTYFGQGGGGGGGAPPLWIMAARIDNAGTISANGGDAGDAAAVIGSPDADGGGGGGGGVIGIVYYVGTLGTVQALGGAGGAGLNAGAAGQSGGAGTIVTIQI